MSVSSGTTLISPTSTLTVGSRGPNAQSASGVGGNGNGNGHHGEVEEGGADEAGNAARPQQGHARPRRQSSHAHSHSAHGHTKRRQHSHSHASHAGSGTGRRPSEGEHGRRAVVAGLTMHTLDPAKPKRKGSGEGKQKPPNKSSRSDTNIPSLSRANSDSSSSKIAKAGVVRRASSRQSSRTSSRHSSPAPLNRRKSVVLDSAGKETGEVDSADDEDWEEEEEGASGGRPKGGNVRKTSERLGKSAKQGAGASSADMRRTMSDSQARPPSRVNLQPLTRTKSNVVVDDSAGGRRRSSGASTQARQRADSSASASTKSPGVAPQRPGQATRKTTGFTGGQTHPDPSASTPAHALNDPMHVMPAHQIKHQQSARSLHALTATTSTGTGTADDKDRLQRTRSQTGESRRSLGSIGPLSRTSSGKGRERSPVTTPGTGGGPQPQRQESALSMELSRHSTPAGSRNITPAPTPGPSSPVNQAKDRAPNAREQKQTRGKSEADEDESEIRVDASDALPSSARPDVAGPDTSPSYPFPKVLPAVMDGQAGQAEGQAVLAQSPEAMQAGQGGAPDQEHDQDQASSEERKHTRSSRDPSGSTNAAAAARERRSRDRQSRRSPARERRSFPPGPSQLSSATKAPSTDTSSASTELASAAASRQTSHQQQQYQQYQHDSSSGARSRQASGTGQPQGPKTLKHRYSNSSIRSIQSLRAPPHPLNSPTGYRSHMASATISQPGSASSATFNPHHGSSGGLHSPARAKPPSMHYPPAAPPIINPEQAAGHAWEIPEDGEYGSASENSGSAGPRGLGQGQTEPARQSRNQAQGSAGSRGQPPMPRSGSFASVRSITNILSGVSVSAAASGAGASGHDRSASAGGTGSGESPRPNRRRTALEATSAASKYRTTSSAAEYHSSLGFPSTSAETAHLISRFLPPKKIRRPAWDISPEDMRNGNIPANGVGLTNGDYREAHESLVRTMRNLGVGEGEGTGQQALSLPGRRGVVRSTSGNFGQPHGGLPSPLSMTMTAARHAGGANGDDNPVAAGLGVVRGAQGNLLVAKGGWNGRTPFELSVDRCLAQRPTYRGVSGGVLNSAA